tara:strand:- start:2273 stop:2950 length:678 start_codon:yes stop_codon:yes gene_type:complete
MSYEASIVKKPWGYEYLAYENDEVALWFLRIKKEHKTSMHCHPSKTTGLIVLDGTAEVSFLSDKFQLPSHNKIMIRKGLFHSTQAISDEGICMFEIETPVDKNDLVRLRDSYGRAGKPYEDESFEIPKEDDCLWIEDPAASDSKVYHFSNSKLTVSKPNDITFFNIDEDKNVMFLKGGIVTDYNIRVAGAGDIVSTKVLKELINTFTKVEKETIVMTMEKESKDG